MGNEKKIIFVNEIYIFFFIRDKKIYILIIGWKNGWNINTYIENDNSSFFRYDLFVSKKITNPTAIVKKRYGWYCIKQLRYKNHFFFLNSYTVVFLVRIYSY